MQKPQLNLQVREPNDDDAIAGVVRAAFGGEGEVRLIAALRHDGAMNCEFVAKGLGGIVGYIAFSNLNVRAGDETINAAALAPIAVKPDHQRQGIGEALTEHGLAHLRAMGVELAVVLGHPAYYPRFGFSPLLAKLLDAPYSGDGFMALELKPRVLGQMRWKVTYAKAFSA